MGQNPPPVASTVTGEGNFRLTVPHGNVDLNRELASGDMDRLSVSAQIPTIGSSMTKPNVVEIVAVNASKIFSDPRLSTRWPQFIQYKTVRNTRFQ